MKRRRRRLRRKRKMCGSEFRKEIRGGLAQTSPHKEIIDKINHIADF